MNESTPIGNKYWDYAENKAKCERLLLKYYQETGFPVTIVRPGPGYAPFTFPAGFAGQGFGIIERILNDKPILIHGDGTGLRTLIFDEDFARAFVPLIKLDSVIGETFQITSDELMTWLQIHQEIGKALNHEVKFEFASSHLINRFDASVGATLLGDRAHNYIFDNSKIKKFIPSFSPSVKFSKGIKLSIDYYKNNPKKVLAFADEQRNILMDKIIDFIQKRYLISDDYK